MTGHSVCIDFKLDPVVLADSGERKQIVYQLLPFIEPFSGTLEQRCECLLSKSCYFWVFSSDSMSYSIKMYCDQGLVSTTVEYYTNQVNEHKIANDDGRAIERLIREKFDSPLVKVLPAVKRAPPVNLYFTSSDDRILEYDSEKILFDETSDFQRVQIYQTVSYGNLLVLDDLQNLAESDLDYTLGLMNKPKESYKGKEVLILGGGDGALLYEILKDSPKFVTMIDIDEVVMKACRLHLKSVCGNVLDNYDGDNYKIIVGDAIAYMKEYIAEKKRFDYVFGDLTDVPISPTPRGEIWDFMRTILELGTTLITPKIGKYMTHAIGIQCESALNMFEEQLKKLPAKISFTRTNTHVPSFRENWCFYQVTKE